MGATKTHPGAGERIDALMRSMGFTCDESFSVVMRVHSETVARWRRGEELPKQVLMARLARICGVGEEAMAAHIERGAPLPTAAESLDDARAAPALAPMLKEIFSDSTRMQLVSDGLMSICFDTEDVAHRQILAWAMERGSRLREHASRQTLKSLSRGSVSELRSVLERAGSE